MVSSVNDKLNNFRKAWSCVLALSASRIFNSPDAPLFIKFRSKTLLRLSFLLAWNSHCPLMRSLRASLSHLTLLAYASATIAFQRRCFADFPLPCWGRLSRPLFLSFLLARRSLCRVLMNSLSKFIITPSLLSILSRSIILWHWFFGFWNLHVMSRVVLCIVRSSVRKTSFYAVVLVSVEPSTVRRTVLSELR